MEDANTFLTTTMGDGKEESSAAMVKANLGQRRHGAGGETGRVGCGGRPRF